MQKLVSRYKVDLFFFGVVILLAGFAGRWLLQPGYFNMHDDLQMLRQRAMEECFQDFQIPCRWTQHMGYGFGFPLFNYYPPLPYLIGESFRLLGFHFVDTVKYTFFLSIVVSGVGMYLLASQFWGRVGGLVSATFYIWAPYHSVDVFVRGAMNEAWALAWFPFILWSSYKLIKEAQFRWIIFLTVFWFSLLTTHNLMVVVFAPVFLGWVILWLLLVRSWLTISQLLFSGVWSLGLAAFFTLPAFLEKNLVHVETLVVGYYEYIAHFASANQLLFSRFWGYGASVWLTDDKMSFQVGHLHWIIPIVVVGVLVQRYIKTRRQNQLLLVTCYFFLVGWVAIFMAHSRSTPLWLLFDPVIKFLQFPWRFLSIVIFAFSFVVGSGWILVEKRKKIRWFITASLLIGVILLNKDYFQPEKMGALTDEEKFSGAAWELQQTAGIYDYLPKGARTAPKEPQKGVADILAGEGSIIEGSQGTNWAKFKINITSDTAKVRINIFEFPNWIVFVDGKKQETFIGDDEWGRMHITLNKGEHEVSAQLFNTPVRNVANFISVVSWLTLLTVPVWRRR